MEMEDIRWGENRWKWQNSYMKYLKIKFIEWDPIKFSSGYYQSENTVFHIENCFSLSHKSKENKAFFPRLIIVIEDASSKFDFVSGKAQY